MNKRITFLKGVLLALVMLVASGNAWAQATLPFTYDSGKPSAITGLTHVGLGTDYSASPKMKFDDSNDSLILNFSTSPGVLTFSIKWNQGTAATRFPGDFKLEQSADGISYSTVQLYNATNGNALANASVVNETVNTLSSTTRFLKWIYSAKSNGNIGLGAISLAAPVLASLDIVSNNRSILASNGSIQLNAAAGESVTIYNAVGQQLRSLVAVDGTNTIAVGTRGLMIVKVGNTIAKVIL